VASASAGRGVPYRYRPADRLADQVEEFEHRGRRAGAQIQHGGVRIGVHREEVAAHGVRDEREVAPLGPVAEDGDRLAGQRRPDHPADRHVVALPWPVDGEVAQRQDAGARSRSAGVCQRELLARQLRHAVRGQRAGRE